MKQDSSKYKIKLKNQNCALSCYYYGSIKYNFIIDQDVGVLFLVNKFLLKVRLQSRILKPASMRFQDLNYFHSCAWYIQRCFVPSLKHIFFLLPEGTTFITKPFWGTRG